MKRSKMLAAGSGLAAVLLVAACSPTGPNDDGGTEKGKRGGDVVMLSVTEPANLDSITAYNAGNRALAVATTRYLFAYDPQSEGEDQTVLHPDLAVDIPSRENGGVSEDGKTVTVTLRDDVKWNTEPARPVVAGDIVRQLKILCNPVRPVPAPAYYTKTIVGMADYCSGFAAAPATAEGIEDYIENTPLAGIEAPDDQTLVFHLLTPTSDFPNILALEFSAPRPAEYLQYLPESKELKQHLLATGPYAITDYRPGVSMQLERNPAWDPDTDDLRSAYVDSFDLKFGIAPDNAMQQFKAGTADLGFSLFVPPAQIPAMLAEEDPNLQIGPSISTQYLVMNNRFGPMADKKVREALATALDRSVLMQLTGGKNLAEVTNQVALPGSAGSVDDPDTVNPEAEGDPDKAREMLAEAGYPDGVKLILAYSNNDADAATKQAQAYQASLGKAGFEIELLPLTGKIFSNDYMRNPDAALKGLWDIAPSGWAPDWKGVANGRSTFVPPFTTPGPGSTNFAGYDSAAFSDLADQALSAPDVEASDELWQQANEQLIEDLPVIPTLYIKDAVYHSSRVQNCNYFWMGRGCALTEVWLEE